MTTKQQRLLHREALSLADLLAMVEQELSLGIVYGATQSLIRKKLKRLRKAGIPLLPPR